MEVRLLNYDLDTNTYQGHEDFDITMPTKCPHCNNTGIQEFIEGAITSWNNYYSGTTKLFPYVEECTLTTACHYCKKFTQYLLGFDIRSILDEFEIEQHTKQTIPDFPISSFQIPLEVEKQYPDFVRIFNQSNAAYESKLSDLAGMGYRKSIEFLVTDYLLKNNDTSIDEEWIKNPRTSLSQKIEKLNKPRLTTLAKAIVYLGNDETHYTRRHEEYCIEDLQSFIKLFISEIESDLIFENATKLVSKE
ncbi:hypothetical protein [Enterococcus sp. AZ102]|uniref:hypothetical protein n=1 Tax=Enterococcus sp. AZ102 TaxID=2774865 RepID=UPI003F250453